MGSQFIGEFDQGFSCAAKFGAPLKHDQITPETYTKENIVYQIGVAPVRLDILTRITAFALQTRGAQSVKSTFLGIPIYFISLDDLITNKQAAGRSADLEHLEHLRKSASEDK